jgi:hypothetical protein
MTWLAGGQPLGRVVGRCSGSGQQPKFCASAVGENPSRLAAADGRWSARKRQATVAGQLP